MAGEVYKDIDLDFNISHAPPVIDVTQYSKLLPVIRATLYDGGVAYTIPSGSTVKVRYKKPSGTVVNEAATFSGNVISYPMSEQCGTNAGICTGCFEILDSAGKIVQTPLFKVCCHENPMQNDDIKDESYIYGIGEFADQAAASAAAAAASETAAQTSATGAEASKSAAQTAASNAQTAANTAAGKATLAAASERNAAISASSASSSATSAANSATAAQTAAGQAVFWANPGLAVVDGKLCIVYQTK